MHALSDILPSSCGSEWAIQPEALVQLEARVRNELGGDAWRLVASKREPLSDESCKQLIKAWKESWIGPGGDTQRIVKAFSGIQAARPGTVPKVSGAVAILPLYGVLVPKANEFTDLFGMTGMNRFGMMFQAALSNDSIKGIVIDVDSPGGTVAGTAELANLLYESRTSGKPTVAVANGLAASAAYWIATSAKTMVVTPSGEVGSVGVFMVHTDYSEMLKQDGIKPTLIHAGKYKVEGNPYEPLSDEGREHLQASVDESYDNFVGALARNREASKSHVLAKFGEGRMLRAKPAREANMVDRVQTMQEVLRQMGVTRITGAAATAQETELAAMLAEAGNQRDESKDQPANDVEDLRRRVRLRERVI